MGPAAELIKDMAAIQKARDALNARLRGLDAAEERIGRQLSSLTEDQIRRIREGLSEPSIAEVDALLARYASG